MGDLECIDRIMSSAMVDLILEEERLRAKMQRQQGDLQQGVERS